MNDFCLSCGATTRDLGNEYNLLEEDREPRTLDLLYSRIENVKSKTNHINSLLNVVLDIIEEVETQNHEINKKINLLIVLSLLDKDIGNVFI